MDHMKMLCDIGELSQIFADSLSIKAFLQKIVVMVAKHMEADVCSIYLFDDERQELTLKATEGLNPIAIGKVKLKLGEGLAGLALKELRPICEKIGSQHPNFKFFPGIFEERYESFLAVPILRGILKIGVLVVQRERKNPFTEPDSMALRVVTSQLANIIENARLLTTHQVKHEEKIDDSLLHTKKIIKGKVASEGFALASVFILDQEKSLDSFIPKDLDGSYTPDDFRQAVAATEQQLKALQQQVEEKLSDVASLIFTAHLLMLKDKQFAGAMTRRIEKGESPPAVILSIAQKYIEIFSRSTNPYIREKVQDVKDLALRLLGNLIPDSRALGNFQGHIVIARELFPSDILKLSSEKVGGIILVTGGVTSHLSILARSLRIPLVIVDLPQLLMVPEDTRILLDAELGNIYINPSEEVIQSFKVRNDDRARIEEQKYPMSATTATRDGIRVKLMANINLLTDLKLACELHAEGVGLYRTEFPFLIRSNFPTEEEQFVIYRKLVKGMPGNVTTLRTLDIGGDKILPYYPDAKEKNPFLGMRSIRFSLHNKEVFRQQIRAILRAGTGADARIMFPMISSVDEFHEARETVLECMEALRKETISYNEKLKIGMMVAIPSVVDIIDELAQEADFFCIGTNDFIQYMLAVDRTNEKVAGFYLPHHPSVLRAIKKVVDAACRHGIEVSICGDMAHEEKYLPYFLGIGVRVLSLDPAYLPKIQKAISEISMDQAIQTAETILSLAKVSDIARILD